MKTTFEKLDNVTGEITVAIDEKDYADKVEKQLKEIGRKHAEPGFRPGHTPTSLLKKKYGASVKYDAVNKAIADAVYDYIKENDLHVLAQPIADKDNIFKDEETEFVFKFKVGLAPEFNDHVDKDLHVPYYEIEVTDQMVDGQVKSLRERFGQQVPGEETEPNAVIKGEIKELNPDGTEKEGGIVVENGIIAPIHFTDDEQKHLFDQKHPGDKVVFNPAKTCNNNETELSSMLNIDKADTENHHGDFSFDIKEIIVLKPAEMNQDFFDMAIGKDKAHNEEEFRAEIKKLIQANFSNESNYLFDIDARKAILKAVGSLELPTEILKDFLIQQNKDLNSENIDQEFDKMKDQIDWDLIKDEIAQRFKIEVTENDLLNEARGIVIRQLSQYSPGALSPQLIDQYAKDFLKEPKGRNMMMQNALNVKVFDTIKNNVTLDKQTVSLEKFQELVRSQA